MGIKVLICGGGNGAHVLAGIASSQSDVDETRVLTLFSDEAERWTNAMKNNDFVVTLHLKDKTEKLKSKPTIVSKDAAAVVPGCDIIVFTVPAFAHAGYLKELKPFIKPGVVLAGCPGNAGFEFAVRGIWGDLATQCSVMSFESLPWACRMTQFGSAAEVLGTKSSMSGAITHGSVTPPIDAVAMLQTCLGKNPVLIVSGHLLGITLMGTNGYLHPSIMYGRWHDWDGKAVEEKPLFYNGLDDYSANTLSSISDEILATAKAITRQRPQVDLSNVSHIYDWYLKCYGNDITDNTNLFTCIRTNNAYKGLTHPMKKTEDGKYVIDFSYRYTQEDIPYGMVVMKGIAAIAGVDTPTMDKVITWAQKVMGKEYLVGSSLSGKDVCESRAPQAHGISTLDIMLGLH